MKSPERRKSAEPLSPKEVAARARMGKLMSDLAVALREVTLEVEGMTVPEKAALVRRELEARSADDALDEFVSWFELEDE